MSEKKRFSLVMPTYQNKKLIKNTLQVLNRQKGYSAEDYEAVVIDDGSTDGTGEYIKGINRNYGLKYIYMERNGESSRSRARNKGIKAACGEIIIFIDGDMLVKEDYLREIDRCFKVREDIVVIGNRVMLDKDAFYEEDLRDRYYEAPGFMVDTFNKMEIRHIMYKHLSYNSSCQIYPWMHVFSCNMAVSKKLLDRNGYFDENFKGWGMEDVELGYRLYKAGAKIIINNRIEAFHQCHSKENTIKIGADKYQAIARNAIYFAQKYPEALGLPVYMVEKLFKGNAILNLNAVRGIRKRVEINYSKKNNLEAIKSEILKLSAKSSLNIIVRDFVEKDDLDLWIQLLEKPKSIPRYFPMSQELRIKNNFDMADALKVNTFFLILGLNRAIFNFYYKILRGKKT